MEGMGRVRWRRFGRVPLAWMRLVVSALPDPGDDPLVENCAAAEQPEWIAMAELIAAADEDPLAFEQLAAALVDDHPEADGAEQD